jgi:hypothetical protein
VSSFFAQVLRTTARVLVVPTRLQQHSAQANQLSHTSLERLFTGQPRIRFVSNTRRVRTVGQRANLLPGGNSKMFRHNRPGELQTRSICFHPVMHS